MTVNLKSEDVVVYETGKEPEDDIPVIPVIPVGYKMLVKPKAAKTQTAGGILLPEETVNHEDILCNVGQVVAQGGQCYQHPKFLGQRWCEVGNWVVFAKYAGTLIEGRSMTDGDITRYRLLNDDEVGAVVPDPDVIRSHVA